MPPPRKPPGAVRIIGGQWKRSVLPVLDAAGLRPTPDRVRETLFNWLAHALGALDGRPVLDLFAGSGALGFEAASRGAAPVTLVERNPKVADRLREAKARLRADAVDVVYGDALVAGRRMLERDARFDVIFLDPPFDSDLVAPAVAVATRLATPAGLIYVESAGPVQGIAGDAWEVFRADKAGDVFYHLLQRKKTE